MPGNAAVASLAITIEVLDDKGQPIGEPLVQGRTTGTPLGSLSNEPIDMLPDAAIFLAFIVGLDIQEAGRYGVRLMVNDEVIAETWFVVIAPPSEGIDAAAAQR